MEVTYRDYDCFCGHDYDDHDTPEGHCNVEDCSCYDFDNNYDED